MACYIRFEGCKCIVFSQGKVSCKWEDVCQKEAFVWRAPLLQQVCSDVWPFLPANGHPSQCLCFPVLKFVFLSGWNKAKCWFGLGCLFVRSFFWVCPLLWFLYTVSAVVWCWKEKRKTKHFLHFCLKDYSLDSCIWSTHPSLAFSFVLWFSG